MAKFVVAFRDRDTAERIASLLREGGYEVIRICTDGDDVKRTFHKIHDGILVSGYRLKDRYLDQIAEDLDERAEVLALMRADQSVYTDSARLFLQKLPVTRSELMMWADMLTQLHDQKMPRRSGGSRDLIEEAKQQVMAEKNMSENEAHRYLQRISMKLGLRMEQVAERILSHNTV